MNMFAKNNATTIKGYMDAIPEDRKATIAKLDQLIRDAAPKLEPYFATNMLGYGKLQYLDSKKKPQDWPIVALANQKNYISLYICGVVDGEYLAEKYLDKLGKVKAGRSCIQISKLENVNIKELKKVIELAQDNPGIIGATLV